MRAEPAQSLAPPQEPARFQPPEPSPVQRSPVQPDPPPGSPGPTASTPAPSEETTTLLATAVYITGSTRLDAGRRYGLALRGPRLQILGPTDIDPRAIVLNRALEGLEATTLEGRLIVSDPNGKTGFVAVFMSIMGPGTDALAGTIQSAAEAAARTGRPGA